MVLGWLPGVVQPGRSHAHAATATERVSRATTPPLHRWDRDPGTIGLVVGDQTVWRFHFGTNATKPLFHPVAPVGGPVLTWDRPADHAWHRALWFSWKFIDGINYWEEDAKTGRAQGLTLWEQPRIELRPDFSARIAVSLSYHPASNAPPALRERRVIDLAAPGADGSIVQDWRCEFVALTKDVRLDRTPLPDEPGGQPYGGYAGLSVRFAEKLEEVQICTTEGVPMLKDGRYRGRAVGAEFSGSVAGRIGGIAILDDPSNPRHPTTWYIIDDGHMRYFSPAFLAPAAWTLRAGEKFTLHYRVIVHPGRWDTERLRQAVAEYWTPKP